MSYKGAVSLDADNVLLKMDDAWFAWARSEYPLLQISAADIHKWDVRECLGISNAELNAMWDFTYGYAMQPDEGSRELVEELRRRDYDIHVITAREYDASRLNNPLEVAMEDLEEHFQIPRERVHSAKDKVPVLRDIRALFHVDDKWQIAQAVGGGTDAVSYLVNRPWNQSLDLNPTYKRIFSYLEIFDDFR